MSRIYKEILKLNNNNDKINLIQKWAKELAFTNQK